MQVRKLDYRVITTGLEFPEGPIAMADGSVLVVEIKGGRLTRVSPNGGAMLGQASGYQRFDSLALEAGGNICVATLVTGGISVFSPQGEKIEYWEGPEPYCTNIAFGGPDMRTAYITVSGHGLLIAADWPRAGLPLLHQR